MSERGLKYLLPIFLAVVAVSISLFFYFYHYHPRDHVSWNHQHKITPSRRNLTGERLGKINAFNIGLRERINASLFSTSDLNCDGVTDLILIVAKGDELSGVSLSHGEKRVLWKYNAKGSISALSVIESDEGPPVVLASSTYEGRIYALKIGQLLWTFSPSNETTRGSYFSSSL
ncbi:MAG: hypothetical protein QI199_03640 [Candidatus Korarchaeota archaeon]|nr:hypothetical protein [Candidatus Korarchaeota archaeon]